MLPEIQLQARSLKYTYKHPQEESLTGLLAAATEALREHKTYS